MRGKSTEGKARGESVRIEGKKEALLRLVAGMSEEQAALLVSALYDALPDVRRERARAKAQEARGEEVEGYGRNIH